MKGRGHVSIATNMKGEKPLKSFAVVNEGRSRQEGWRETKAYAIVCYSLN